MARKTPEIIKPIDPREVLKAQARINDEIAGNPVKDTAFIDKLTPEEAQKLIDAMSNIRKAMGFG